MSLINDALKKAQKQRSGEAPPLASIPTVGGERPAQLSPRTRKGSGAPGGLFLWLGLGAGGVAVLLVAGIFLLRDRSQPPDRAETAVSAPAGAPAPASSAATAAPSPSVATPSVQPAPAASAPVVVLPVVNTAEPTPPPAARVENAPAPATASTAPAAASTPAPTEAPAATRGGGSLEPRALQYIDNIRVAGIRASGSDSKVLMNDRVYHIGDMVEHEMQLRLVGITANSLTFEDGRGGRYTRNF